MEEKVKFGFGVCQSHCETETFDSVEELIAYAQALRHEDGGLFEEDMGDVIWVGTAETFTVSDFAPGLDDIADQITDRFYSTHNVDEYQDAQINHRKEAEEYWEKFVEKYFELPAGISITCQWFGVYNLRGHKWVEKFEDFDKYVKE